MNNRTNVPSQLIPRQAPPKVNPSYRPMETPEYDQPCIGNDTIKENVTQIESQFRILEREMGFTREILTELEGKLQPILRPELTNATPANAPIPSENTVPLAQRLEEASYAVSNIRSGLNNLLNQIEL